jgi:hypothetical protein
MCNGLGVCRTLVIEPTTSESQDADGVVWSLPAFVPLLKINEGGNLTLSNFTIWAKTDECNGVVPRREWFFHGRQLNAPVFGGILPRAFIMGPNDSGSKGVNEDPAAVTIQSMRFKFER